VDILTIVFYGRFSTVEPIFANSRKLPNKAGARPFNDRGSERPASIKNSGGIDFTDS